jgi:electron transport complex protein RnfG
MIKKPRFSILNAGFLFVVITLISVLILGVIHHFTKDIIEQLPTYEKYASFRDVYPSFHYVDSFPKVFHEGKESIDVYKTYDEKHECIGAIVCSTSHNGYVGEIDVLIGFNNQGDILNYRVISHKETIGLGARIVNWFKSKEHNRNIIGIRANETNLSLVNEGGEIDAITGATVSSRAFLFAVRNAFLILDKHTDVLSHSKTLDTLELPVEKTDELKVSTLKGE